MSADAPIVELGEWQQATPNTCPALTGLSLPRASREAWATDRQRRMVTVRELRTGLAIATTSFVGSVTLGPVTVLISPKIAGESLPAVVGYALGLTGLHLLSEHRIGVTTPAFQDLLADRLTTESNRLISGGLHRHYTSRQELLAAPKGRILFDRLVRSPTTSAVLPCRYSERDENVLANQVLLAGLRVAARVALDPIIRAQARRTATVLAQSVQRIPLNASTWGALGRVRSRLTKAYEPAFRLVRLLQAGQGISSTRREQSIELPGFLIDMNLLFQSALGRFLRTWLDDSHVQEQHRLTDIFRYQAAFNPRRKRPPTPRPDYVITRGSHVTAIADAKYRDLWANDLPSGMLYQLSVYALSQGACDTATILYATATPTAREARIDVHDPIASRVRAHICLRPVYLPQFAALITARRSAANDRRRREYAAALAHPGASKSQFGSTRL